MTGRTIFGVFDDPTMADGAIDALQEGGFRNEQIHAPTHHTSGGFMAGIKHFFLGEEAARDTSAGNFSGMGLSDEEAHYYENESQAGHRVVAVQANGHEQEAMDILRTNGAYTYGTKRGATQTTSAPASASRLQTADTNEERVLRLREEQLNVNKQRVQTGEVQLRKEIVTEQKTVNVPVTHEEVFIERRAVTGATASDSMPIGEGENIRVPLSEERVNVSKNTVVTGDVSIGTRAVQETKQVTETMKREEAHIEQEGDAPIHGTTSDHFHPDSMDKNKL